MRLLEWLLGKHGGRTLDDAARRLKFSPAELKKFPIEYREFSIPKRSKGVRVIRAPSRELRLLQRRILHRLLDPLRCHPAATGFEKRQSIVTNALPHIGQAVIVKMDIKDFFPSITDKRVEAYFRKVGWNPEASALLTKLVTLEGRLPQGAPTSPRLSNLVNQHLDARLSALARRLNAAYTRYADDLTFSFKEDSPGKVRTLIHITSIILREEGYEPHRKDKLYVRRRCDRQVVTGLVVNDHVDLPRETRRWLRAVEHRIQAGRTPTITPDELNGWRALRKMIREQSSPESKDAPTVLNP